MSEERRDYRVGFFVLVGFVILGVLILLYGESPFWFLATKYELSVQVHNPRGVQEGTPAFLQGVQVGRTKALKFQIPENPSMGAAVVVTIEQQYEIPRGSTATIHPAFGFGQGEIHISPPREPREPLPRDGSAAIRGKMVGALESIVPQEYIDTLGSAVEKISDASLRIGDLADEVSIVTYDLHELLKENPIDMVDDPDKGRIANVHTLVARTDRLFKSLNEIFEGQGGQDIRETITNLKTASRRITDVLDRAEGSLATIDTELGESRRAFVETSERLAKLLDEIHVSVVAINQMDGTVGRLLHDPKLYEELLDTVEQLERALIELREGFIWVQTESRIAW